MINNPHPTLLSHRLNRQLKKTGLALAVLLATFLAACATESSSTTPDTPAPPKPQLAAPQNLVASVYSATAVEVSWQAVSNATGYNIYYSSTQNFKVATASSKMGITNLSTNVGGLTTGTAYYFRVKAVDSSNRFSDSPLSAEATATPAGLTTAGKVKATNAAANSRALKWAPVTGATSYTVEYSTNLIWSNSKLMLGAPVLKKENITGTNTTITGLEDVFYAFQVKAHQRTETSSGPIAAIPRNKAQLQEAIKIKFTSYGSGRFDPAVGATENLNYIDTSQVASFSYLFEDKIQFNGDISQWDTSKVTDMEGMFQTAEGFNGDISQWDTSKVTNMFATFNKAKKFNQDIGGWDTSKVINMRGIFFQADVFNQALKDWEVGKVTNMELMFKDAKAFDQDLSGWDVSSVTTPTDKSTIFAGSPLALAAKKNYWPRAWQE